MKKLIVIATLLLLSFAAYAIPPIPGSYRFGGVASSTWTTYTDFTTAPASTSTLTMTSNESANILIGMPLQYVIGGNTYYGIVTAISSNLLTLAGVPLSGNVTALKVGDATRVTVIPVSVPTTYETVTSSDVIGTKLSSNLVWDKALSYLVRVMAWTQTPDSAGNGTVTALVDGNDVLSSDINANVAATTFHSGVTINPAYYAVSNGSTLNIGVTAGANANAYGLVMRFIFVTP